MTDPAKPRQEPWWPHAAVLAAAFIGLTVWSWRKWMDPWIDFGHELYVPWRLLEGETLYTDIAWYMGPASQYVNAAAMAIGGVSLTTLIVVNLAVLALIVTLLHRFFGALAGRWTATAICLFMLAVFGFSQYAGVANYNFICPYRHETVHGLLMGLIAAGLWLRFERRGGLRELIGIGVCIGLTALMKTELCLPAAGMSVAAMALSWWQRRPGWRRAGIEAAAIAGGATAMVALAIAGLSLRMSPAEALAGVLTNWRCMLDSGLTRDYPFYTWVMGTDDPGGNLRRMAAIGAWLAVAAAAAFGLDRWLPAGRYAAPIAATVTFGLGLALVPNVFWLDLPRPLPLLSLAAGGCAVWAIVRRRQQAPPWAFGLAIWSVYALVAALKLFIRLRVPHYGFVLAVPATMLLLYVLLEGLPALARRHGGTGRLARGIGLGLMAAMAASCLRESNLFYGDKRDSIGRGGDRFYYDSTASPANYLLPRLAAYLEETMAPGETLFVLPEGTTLNYLMRRRTPVPYLLLMPWEMRAGGGEEKVLADLAASPPDVIVVLTAGLHEHGYARFGAPGYGDRIVAWLESTRGAPYPLSIAGSTGAPILQALVYRQPAPP